MRRKSVLTIALLVIFLISNFLPIKNVYAETTEETNAEQSITFDKALYNAVKSQLEIKGIKATYNDAQCTIKISQEDIDSITELKLSGKEIENLTNLDVFKNVTSIDLSANKLTEKSNLNVLNTFKLKFLDLSSNEISDISSISTIKNIEKVNLHNQIFEDVTIISNKIVDEGQTTYEIELPQIVNEFAKPIKSEWLEEEIVNNETESKIKIDWSSFNANSNTVKLIIGESNGTKYNGLATIKLKIKDMTNTLYNSEIELFNVVIDENQRAIFIEDENLYKAVKDQLTKAQDINANLKVFTDTRDLYDNAYDKQKILIINEDDLINKINSLLLDSQKIENLSGIESFVGLEDKLDVSSNYVNNINNVIALQLTKELEERNLQSKFAEKAAQLKEKLATVETLQAELKKVITDYDSAVDTYNALDRTSLSYSTNELNQKQVINGLIKKYNELTGATVAEGTVVKGSLTDYVGYSCTGGTLGKAIEKSKEKIQKLYDCYNAEYKLTSVITPKLKNISDVEYEKLSLVDAKALLQEQNTKITSIEKYFTSKEKEYVQTKFGVIYTTEEQLALSKELAEKIRTYEEDEASIISYKEILQKLREFDAYVMYSSSCIINRKMNNDNSKCYAENYQEYEKDIKEENKKYITDQKALHDETASDENLMNYYYRIINASSEDITAYITISRLYELNMKENLIENIDNISMLKELRKLNLADNEIINIKNVNWSNMTQLNELNLGFNNISEINSLESLSDLKKLDLSKNIISGKFNMNLLNMPKLKELDLSDNQIDDISYLKEQYEFIAKNYNKEIKEFLLSEEAPKINLNEQTLRMDAKLSMKNSIEKIELPLLFRQLEELQWKETSFGMNSYFGNVTSDGKYVILNTDKAGKRTAQVTIMGGLGNKTVCIIDYEITENEEKTNTPPTEDNKNIIITINTADGSNVKAVIKKEEVNYILVSKNTTAKQLLGEVSLNQLEYNVSVKSADNTTKLENESILKTNTVLSVDGLEDKTKCIIVVKGDITADGDITMSDILKLNQYRNKKVELTDAEKLAGNVVDSDDEITMSDILKLNQYRLNKINEL